MEFRTQRLRGNCPLSAPHARIRNFRAPALSPLHTPPQNKLRTDATHTNTQLTHSHTHAASSPCGVTASDLEVGRKGVEFAQTYPGAGAMGYLHLDAWLSTITRMHVHRRNACSRCACVMPNTPQTLATAAHAHLQMQVGLTVPQAQHSARQQARPPTVTWWTPRARARGPPR